MTFAPIGSGYAVPIDDYAYSQLLSYFSTSDDELQNVICPGDFERAENVADAQASCGYDKFYRDDLVGEAGVWYIWSDGHDPEIEGLLSSFGFTGSVDGTCYYNIMTFVCDQ